MLARDRGYIDMKFALALSGGALRGVTHIGVLKALFDYDLKPSWISGTSAGSMIASLYACGYSPYKMEEIALKLNKGIYDVDYLGMILGAIQWFIYKDYSYDGLIKGKKLERLMQDLTKGARLKDAIVPLAITAVDINTGKTIMFVSDKKGLEDGDGIIYIDQGPMYEAVRASIAIPVVFKPKISNRKRLVDGGVTVSVPTQVLRRMGAKKVIGINLGYSGQRRSDVDNLIEIGSQSLDIMAYHLTKFNTNKADIIINPNIYDIGMTDFDRVEECIERGYKSIENNIGMIKNALKS